MTALERIDLSEREGDARDLAALARKFFHDWDTATGCDPTHRLWPLIGDRIRGHERAGKSLSDAVVAAVADLVAAARPGPLGRLWRRIFG